MKDNRECGWMGCGNYWCHALCQGIPQEEQAPYDAPAAYEPYESPSVLIEEHTKPPSSIKKLECVFKNCRAPIVVFRTRDEVLFGCNHQDNFLNGRQVQQARIEFYREDRIRNLRERVDRPFSDYVLREPHEPALVQFWKSLQRIFRFTVRVIETCIDATYHFSKKAGGEFLSRYEARSTHREERRRATGTRHSPVRTRLEQELTEESDLERRARRNASLNCLPLFLGILYLFLIFLTQITK